MTFYDNLLGDDDYNRQLDDDYTHQLDDDYNRQLDDDFALLLVSLECQQRIREQTGRIYKSILDQSISPEDFLILIKMVDSKCETPVNPNDYEAILGKTFDKLGHNAILARICLLNPHVRAKLSEKMVERLEKK